MPRFEHHRGIAHAPFLVRLGLGALLIGFAAADSIAAPPAPLLLVLGDSLSASHGIRVEEGWVALLERRLAEQGYGYRVVNASVSGETSAGGLERLPHLLMLHQPRLVIIELGANDGLRGLPVAALRANLEQLVALAQAAGARVLVIGMRLPGNYGARYTAEFQASFASVASSRHAALVPFLLERIALDDNNFQADHLHPRASAQGALLETVWPALAPLLRPAAARAR